MPKPMVKIANKPIIELIIKHYNKFGFNDFIIAGGYKYKQIKDYFERNLIKLNINVVNTEKINDGR